MSRVLPILFNTEMVKAIVRQTGLVKCAKDADNALETMKIKIIAVRAAVLGKGKHYDI